MGKRLEQVKEFMWTFGQNIADKPIVLDEDTQKLRIALILEELKEYAEASAQLEYFIDLCGKTMQEFIRKDKYKENGYTEIVNQVEQFDALLDLEYVLLGTVLSHGFGNIFEAGFDEVHSSNMSKADDNEGDADITRNKYDDQNIETHTIYNRKTGVYVNYRTEDDKVLKSHKYKPAQLAQFLK